MLSSDVAGESADGENYIKGYISTEAVEGSDSERTASYLIVSFVFFGGETERRREDLERREGLHTNKYRNKKNFSHKYQVSQKEDQIMTDSYQMVVHVYILGDFVIKI
tara:strand:- start:240 stop:563 length:324 start_codon:yes stop_codon:yes gene_type:complete